MKNLFLFCLMVLYTETQAQELSIVSSVGGSYCNETISSDSTLEVVGGGTKFLWSTGDTSRQIWVNVRNFVGKRTYRCVVDNKDTIFYTIRVYPYIKSEHLEIKKGKDGNGIFFYTTFSDTLQKGDILYYVFKKNSENIFERVYADSTEKIFYPTEPGDYGIRIVTPCTGNFLQTSVGTLTSSEEASDEIFKVFPNPASDYLCLSGVAEHVEIINFSGQVLGHFQNTKRIDLLNFSPGIYFARINNSKQLKFIKI